MYKILIADNSVITREGLKSLLSALSVDIEEVTSTSELSNSISEFKPAVLIIDPVSFETSHNDIIKLKADHKEVFILAITHLIPKAEISAYLDAGVTGFLLKDCDKQEICEAIESTRNGVRFLCGKIVDVLVGPSTAAQELRVNPSPSKKFSCEGFVVSEREVEIIKLIALGLSNKQIADKLCLSLHTVNTHRKNILQKLRVNNTAGVVMFAVKNNLLSAELHAN